jgi:hypothetical protein
MTLEHHEQERHRLIEAIKDRDVPVPLDRLDAARDLPVAEAVSRLVDYSHPYYWAPFIYVGAM